MGATMTATKFWGACSCFECGRNIQAGDPITILDGSLYLAGHESRSFLPLEETKPNVNVIVSAPSKLHGPARLKNLPMFETVDAEPISMFA